MSRTWLVRGAAVAVFAALVGAWAVGLAGLGDATSSTEKPATPVAPDDSPVSDIAYSIVRDTWKPRRIREASPSPEDLTEPSPTAVDEPSIDAPGTPTPTSTPPTPVPSDEPSDPPSSQPPSSPPSEPDDECTDLAGVVDCALDPITGHP